MTEAFAEVIATSTSEITGQCRPGSTPPGFGTFVCAGGATSCVGVIYTIESVSMDPNRRPSALGLNPEQLAARHPQLAILMRQNIHALLIGTLENNEFLYGMPGQPPAIHSEITACPPEIIRSIGRDPGFLQMLHRSLPTMQEEILLAVSRTLLQANAQSDSPNEAASVSIGKAISAIYRDDYDSLRRIMERLEQWMKRPV